MTSHILIRSSTKVYMGAQNSLMNTFVSFFDRTPIGRIINRMSGDTFVMDERLSQTLTELIQMGLGIVGSLVWMAIVIPYLIIPFIIILATLAFIKRYVIGIAR